MTDKALRGAVIGYGAAFNMGRTHLGNMRDVGIIPSAMCDIDPTRTKAALQDFPDIQTYASADDLVANPDIDLITVVTPHNTHAELALKALNAGKHVVVEKPMCLTTDEATRMIDAASANSVVLSVYHNRRYDGDFLAMKDVIDRGLIGDIFQIQAGGGHFGEPGMWWRSDKTISGGILYDWGAHFIDWILRMMPDHKAVQVTGFLHHLVWTAHTSEDHGKVIIRFDNGASAELTQSSISAVPMPRWRIQGTKGGLLDDGSVRDGCKIFSSLNGITMSGEIRWKPSQQNPYYKALFAHIATGAESPVTGESARRVISIIESAEKSSNAGRSVALPFG